MQVKAVLAGGAGAAAGLSAGDEILAVDGWRVRRLDDALAWIRTGAAFELLVVRQQRVRTLRVADRAGRASRRGRVAQPEAERIAQRGDAGPSQRLAGQVGCARPGASPGGVAPPGSRLIVAVLRRRTRCSALRVLVQRHRLEQRRSRPSRIEITFAQALQPTAPPPAPRARAARAEPRRARACARRARARRPQRARARREPRRGVRRGARRDVARAARATQALALADRLGGDAAAQAQAEAASAAPARAPPRRGSGRRRRPRRRTPTAAPSPAPRASRSNGRRPRA